MEQNFKNYIRVKTIDSNYREHIDDYEIKFDKYQLKELGLSIKE